VTRGERWLPELSRRARSVALSPTVAMALQAARLKAQGRRIIDLTVGEPDQDTPRPIRRAAERALETGRTRYTPSVGIPDLRDAVALRYRKDEGLAFEAEAVAITCGGKHALALACQALLQAGSDVLIPTPHWPSFGEAVRLAAGRPVFLPTFERDGFRLQASAVREHLSARARVLIVNSPCNPTGATLDIEEAGRIARVARRKNLVVLFDDAYARLSVQARGKGVLRCFQQELGERLVVLGTASKTYAMTGWRIGWVLGPKALISACGALVSHSTQNPTTFAQWGALEALRGSQTGVRAMAQEYKRRLRGLLPELRSIPGVRCTEPGGGFYLFPNVDAALGERWASTVDLAASLLEQEGVGTVPGEAFGRGGYLRLSLARPLAELHEGVRRLRRHLASA
jgi:aspartate aminotransferase